MTLGSMKTLKSDKSGSMAIETALVLPTLILMALGTFDAGRAIARQHELQSAASEAEMIALTAAQGLTVELASMEEIIAESVELPVENIVIEKEFRCDTSNGKVKDKGACPTSAIVTEYVKIDLTDTYTPVWTKFGLGEPINYRVTRTVQVF